MAELDNMSLDDVDLLLLFLDELERAKRAKPSEEVELP
jgi:hypothetical protein